MAQNITTILNDVSAFDPEATDILARAIDKACETLQIPSNYQHEREVIAGRVADLARSGVLDANALSERVILEAQSNI